MFGYIKPRTADLTVRENEFYKAVYCGICRTGGKRISRFTRLLLNHDFVLLCIVRMAVCGDVSRAETRRCPYSLKKKCMLCQNGASLYTSAAFGILLYYKALDDIADSKGMARFFAKFRRLFARRMFKRASGVCPGFSDTVKEQLSVLSGLEKARCASPDLAADAFAKITAATASYGVEGDERGLLAECGYHIGRYIYIIDAFEDSKRDEKKNTYNVLLEYYGSAQKVFEAASEVERTLRDSIHAFCRSYEKAGGSVYDRLVYNIAELGSADAFSAAVNKLKGTDK